MGDHYQTLGLGRDATKAEVKAAFRRSALRDHPDRHASSTAAARADAARRFRLASDAYHVLSDDRRRAEYDLRLRGSASSYARSSSSGWASSSSASYSYGYGYGHGGSSWRRTPPGAGAGKGVGSIDWEFLLKGVTRRGFLINLGFASVLLSGAAFLDGSILEIWNMNNSGHPAVAAVILHHNSEAKCAVSKILSCNGDVFLLFLHDRLKSFEDAMESIEKVKRK